MLICDDVFFCCFLYSRRQFITVRDAFVKLENIAEAINEMLPKFSSQL